MLYPGIKKRKWNIKFVHNSYIYHACVLLQEKLIRETKLYMYMLEVKSKFKLKFVNLQYLG